MARCDPMGRTPPVTHRLITGEETISKTSHQVTFSTLKAALISGGWGPRKARGAQAKDDGQTRGARYQRASLAVSHGRTESRAATAAGGLSLSRKHLLGLQMCFISFYTHGLLATGEFHPEASEVS